VTVSQRLVALATVAIGLVVARPAHGQLVVNDPLNTAQAIALVQKTISEYQTLVQQYQEIVRMSQGLPAMARYRTVPVALTEVGCVRQGRPRRSGRDVRPHILGFQFQHPEFVRCAHSA